MKLFEKFRKNLRSYTHMDKGINPVKAYNLWARQYDAQPDNLMLALEGEVFTSLLRDETLRDKVIIDIGCGTGRHWGEVLKYNPASLSGYDVSLGMLGRLKEKYPNAITHQLHDNYLSKLDDESCDVIITTLTIAHIQNIEEAFKEWDRVLKSGGEILLTDYHPTALANDGDRTFVHGNKLISIRNYVHSIEKILGIILPLDFQVLHWNERVIDDTVKHFYEEKNAVHVFEKFKDMPIVYGAHLKKKNVTT